MARIYVAFDDDALEPSPTWTRIDTEVNVAGYTIDRGRAIETDKTDTGEATVTIWDRDGTLDPTNTFGTFWSKIDPFRQVKIELRDPVADVWKTRFRGFVEEWEYDVDPSQRVTQLLLHCVDAFAIFAANEVAPGAGYGDPVPTAAEGNIFYDNAQVDDRIIQLLGDAGWPTALQHIFTGNVNLKETIVAPRATILSLIQDAADAEFPGVANVYVDRQGFVTFHGRLARFDPETVAADAGSAWDFHHWKAGDGAAVQASPTDMAHIRPPFKFARGFDLVNAAIASPQGIKDSDLAGQFVSDPTSIAKYGVRSWSAENLLTDGHVGPATTTDLAETKKFAEYYKLNRAQPSERIAQLSFKSMAPIAEGAAANWALIVGCDISDLVDVTFANPGSGDGGFDAVPYFIEGIHEEVRPGNPDYDDVTVTCDVSPQSLYNTDPFS